MLFNVGYTVRDTSKCLSCLEGFYHKSNCTNVTKFKKKERKYVIIRNNGSFFKNATALSD
jgi:hypothetical protein